MTTSTRRDGIETSDQLREAARAAVAGGPQAPDAAAIRAAAADRVYTSDDLRALTLAAVLQQRTLEARFARVKARVAGGAR